MASSILFLPLSSAPASSNAHVSEQFQQHLLPTVPPSALASSSFPSARSPSVSLSYSFNLLARYGSQKRLLSAEDAVVFATGNSAPAPEEYEEYEVELERPYGLRFYKGADGGTYIDIVAPGSNAAMTKMFEPGDKVLATSAVFGTEIWPAAEYGRTMYTIRQRVGPLLMKMQKRYGKREDAAVSADRIAAQRNANALGDAVREIQVQNYLRKMELKKQREAELDEGLSLYKAGNYESALEKFESVLGLKPEPREEAVASYNVACCYSKLNQVEAGLSALEEAMEAGFDDFKTIRTDPDLQTLRNSENFKPLIEKFDESFVNENVVNALKNVFGFFSKK